MRARPLHLPVPSWVIGLVDPAQRYLERSRPAPPEGRARPRRPSRGARSYVPLTADGEPSSGDEGRAPPVPHPLVEHELRERAEARRREADALLGDPLLIEAVKDLQRRGRTVVVSPPAMLSARLVRFRWGDSVLEIDGRHSPGAGVTNGHRTRLSGRHTPAEEAEVVRQYLALALADLLGRGSPS